MVYVYLQGVETSHENPLSNVKFTVAYQKWSFYILLNYLGTHRSIVLASHISIFELVETIDSNTSCVIAWLAYPHVAFAVKTSVLRALIFQDFVHFVGLEHDV